MIAKKYGITHAMVQGIVENAATEGPVRNPGGGFRDGQSFHPINYHELARDLRERVKLLEAKVQSLFDTFDRFFDINGVEEVLVSQLRSRVRLFKKRGKSEARGESEVLEFLVDQKG
ncbi:MAG: hypothetical protein GTN74_09045 [Proteobacteria bacterium]|nr:hypothetical protein [Pseudomonadota bacterium]NIS70099.1 hypothetical protein [Pseudomonadota bacterium]